MMPWDSTNAHGGWLFTSKEVEIVGPFKYLVFSHDHDGELDYTFVDLHTQELVYQFSRDEWNEAYRLTKQHIIAEHGLDRWDAMWDGDEEWDAVMDYWIAQGKAFEHVPDPFEHDINFVEEIT